MFGAAALAVLLSDIAAANTAIATPFMIPCFIAFSWFDPLKSPEEEPVVYGASRDTGFSRVEGRQAAGVIRLRFEYGSFDAGLQSNAFSPIPEYDDRCGDAA